MLNQYRPLTLEQEKQVLRYLQDNMELFLASGSSRAVFQVDEYIRDMLGLNDIVAELVIKMSMGLGGYRQSCLEASTYNYGVDSGCFADIFARGSVFTVMEAIDTDWDFYDFYEEVYDESEIEEYVKYRYGEDISEEEYRRHYDRYAAALRTILTLEDYLGNTSDNSQLGYSAVDKCFKAYDYGFEGGRYAGDQMTRSSDYFSYDEDCTHKFFDIVISQIDESIAAGEEYLGEDEFAVIEDNFILFCDNI